MQTSGSSARALKCNKKPNENLKAENSGYILKGRTFRLPITSTACIHIQVQDMILVNGYLTSCHPSPQRPGHLCSSYVSGAMITYIAIKS